MESDSFEGQQISTHEWLCNFLSTVMDIERPLDIPKDPNTPWKSLNLDSLAMIATAEEIEDHFKIKVDDEDLGEFVTTGDISEYIDKKVANRT
jgi:acyl carrier protein